MSKRVGPAHAGVEERTQVSPGKNQPSGSACDAKVKAAQPVWVLDSRGGIHFATAIVSKPET